MGMAAQALRADAILLDAAHSIMKALAGALHAPPALARLDLVYNPQ